MKVNFRLFIECFHDNEWFVLVDVPDNFANNIQLNDIIGYDVLMSLPEFGLQKFMEALKEEYLEEYKKKVFELMDKYDMSQIRATTSVWVDWMNDWNLIVTARKWHRHRINSNFQLEFWLEDNK